MKAFYGAVLLGLTTLLFTNTCMAAAGLRIVCDGDNQNAEVYVNGKFKGECSLDMQLKEGKYKLLVKKSVGELERTFEQDVHLGDGVLKKIEVQLGAPQIKAEKLRALREAFDRAERNCRNCPAMVFIPAGNFEMGLNGQGADEEPAHHVTLKSFALGKTEVTQGQWKAIMGSNPSDFENCGDNCPVEQVSWDDAKQFIQKLNAKTGKQYRLPTEAEWEYACRAGQQTEYCGGNDINAVAWYKENSSRETHSVGQKQANAFGLYDMSGNVWEWVEDSYHDSYNGAPTDGSTWQGDGAKRVLRGGSWNYLPPSARAAERFGLEPARRSSFLGFRLAMTLPSKQEAEERKLTGVLIHIPGKNYELGKYEVTQAQWRAVIGSSPPELRYQSCGDTCPVEHTSWDDIQIYLQKLNTKTGKQYRLPLDAEWVYACNGGSKKEYCGSDNVDSVAWYEDNSDGTTHHAGQKQANGYGLYDMSGNVFEWQSDCLDGDCSKRVVRGGSWHSTAINAVAAYRYGFPPSSRISFIGFRLARTLR